METFEKYFDHASTTPMSEAAKFAMIDWMSCGNPGNIHPLGVRAKETLNDARAKVARFLGAEDEQIVFTSGGSEANNLAILGIADYLREKKKTTILISPFEHDSAFGAVHSLTTRGFTVVEIPVNSAGYISTHTVEGLIESDDSVGLVVMMTVNNETGLVNRAREIGEMCRNKNVLFATDLVQTAGYFPIDVNNIGCDFASISAHKINGPKGVGALYIRKPKLMNPLIYGGADQEWGLRGGTPNVAAIAGFAAAVEALTPEAILENALKSMTNKLTFLENLSYADPDEEQFALNSGGVKSEMEFRVGKILSLNVPGVHAESLVIALGAKGYSISSGSACHEYTSAPSRVLLASGLTPEQARETVRISFSGKESEEEIIEFASAFSDTVREIRALAGENK